MASLINLSQSIATDTVK